MARYEVRPLRYAEYSAEEMMRRAHDFCQGAMVPGIQRKGLDEILVWTKP